MQYTDRAKGKAVCPQSARCPTWIISRSSFGKRGYRRGEERQREPVHRAEQCGPDDGDPDCPTQPIIISSRSCTLRWARTPSKAKDHQASMETTRVTAPIPAMAESPYSPRLHVDERDGQAGQELEHKRGDADF